MIKKISTPLTTEKVKALEAGDIVHISGVIYTARDAAHKRLVGQLKNNEELPFAMQDSILYYVGPSPAKKGQIIGSAGPTTSYRMDSYSPFLLKEGQRGMIGKGDRSQEVVEAIKKYTGVYFAAVGGAAALLSNHIVKAKVIAYGDLGTEAIRQLEVIDFPVIVVIDSQGNNLYHSEKQKYRKAILNK